MRGGVIDCGPRYLKLEDWNEDPGKNRRKDNGVFYLKWFKEHLFTSMSNFFGLTPPAKIICFHYGPSTLFFCEWSCAKENSCRIYFQHTRSINSIYVSLRLLIYSEMRLLWCVGKGKDVSNFRFSKIIWNIVH